MIWRLSCGHCFQLNIVEPSSSITAALAVKVRRGEHIGRVPFGYDRINQKLVINEEEANVVKRIYDWYKSGWGFKNYK